MRYFLILFVILIVASCQQAPKAPGLTVSKMQALSAGTFGKEVAKSEAVPVSGFSALFTENDTVDAVISGKIEASCKHSGCWMDFAMNEQESVHVTFLDESFTIPLDAAGKNAVAEGIAIRELIPVETLQNYAREDGKSEEEIAAITEPVYAYEFIARGVLIEE
jgi:cytidylate kinase